MQRHLDASANSGADERTANSGAWRTISNTRTGEHLTFEVTGAETGGAFVRVRGFVPAHAAGPPRHRHRSYSESFRVLSGRLTLAVGNRTVVLGPGESETAPTGVAHSFRNDGDDAVELVCEVHPADHFEEHLRALFGLNCDGRMDPINFALAARLGESLPAGPPVLLARALVGILAWVGDRLGRDGSFPQYTRPPAGVSVDK